MRIEVQTELTPCEQAQGVRVDAVLMIGEALHRFTQVRIACPVVCVCGGVLSARGVALTSRSHMQGGVGVTSHRVVNTGQPRSSTVFKLRPRPDVVGPRTEADYALLLLQQPCASPHH